MLRFVIAVVVTASAAVVGYLVFLRAHDEWGWE